MASTILGLLLLACVAFAVWFVIRMLVRAVMRRRRRSAVELKRPSIRVAAAGFEKAGKTVYLGSMFATLRVPGKDLVLLSTRWDLEGRLMELHRRTADTHEPFPDATAKGNTEAWPFTISVKLQQGVVEVADFTYLDFAGETLRDMYQASLNPATQELKERFEDADVLMGVLDGALVNAYLKGNAPSAFFEDLGTLLSLLSRHPRPTQLILTKWDLLEGAYPFGVVVDRLFQLESFRNFVGSQTSVGGTCRLIPVSAVGPGFARQVGDAMVKNAGEKVQPTMTELPVACAVGDAITRALVAADRRNIPSARRQARMRDWVTVTYKFAIGPAKIDIHRPDMLRRMDEQIGRVPARHLDADHDASVRLLRYCQRRLEQLDATYPESNLSESPYVRKG
jgi:hypothetical protein